MIYNNSLNGPFCSGGKNFTVGDRVFCHTGDYAGLYGVILECRTGIDKDTDNEGDDIYVEFECPEDPATIREIEARFSALYAEEKNIEELPLDYVIMDAEEIDLAPAEPSSNIASAHESFYKERAMTEEESKYTFRQSAQISGQTGLIGYLHADMDTDGNGFFSSWNDWRGWNDWRENLKTDEFKAEFDKVINSLREEGGILHDRKTLANYCYSTPQSKMQTERDYYGVRVDTEKYTYLLRLNPNKGEYNLYCYCYVKDWLDGHMREAQKGIRFIDSHYKELFRIPDGGKIKIHYSWNEDQVRTCRYIDDYHVEVGENLYHIYQFAECMEQNGHTYEPLN